MRILLAFLFLWSATSFARNPTACDELPTQAPFGDLSLKFEEWSFDKKNLKLNPEDFLPRDFIEKIEAAPGLGKIGVGVHYRDDVEGVIEVWVHVNFKNLIAQFTLARHPTEPHSVILEGLRMENPLPPPPDVKRDPKLDQNRNSLPSDVFFFMKNRLVAIAKAGHFTQITCPGGQNFSVLMLYRRIVGMVPKHNESAAFVTMLDSYYEVARRKLPVDVRAKSVQEFNGMLGGTAYTHNTKEMLDQFSSFLKSNERTAPKGVELHRDENGKAIAFIWRNMNPAKVSFIDRSVTPPRLLEWNDAASRGATALLWNFN